MTLQQLEYIVAIEEYGHFGKAAEACGITQPTLSLMVKKLEEELDVTLFDRDRHPVRPTEMGAKVIHKARGILFSAGQLSEMTRSEKQLATGDLRLAMISTVAPVLISGMVSYLQKNHSGVNPIFQEMLTENIIFHLKRAELDMGIVTSPVSDPELLEIPLYSEKFVAYVSPDSPLYSLPEIDFYDRPDTKIWIINNGIRSVDFNWIRGGRLSYERMFEGGRVSVLINLVNSLGGVTIIPESQVGLILYSMHAHIKPIVRPDSKRTISLVMRRDYYHETMMNIVVDAVKSVIPALMHDEMISRGRLVL